MAETPAKSSRSERAKKVAPSPPEIKIAASKRSSAANRSGQTKQQSPDQRATLAAALARWFKGTGYHVGLDLQRLHPEGDRKWAANLADVVQTLLGGGGATWISSGPGSEELFKALIQFLPLADIVASRVDFGTVVVPLAIFADRISPAELDRRLTAFLEFAPPLAEFGPRLNNVAMGAARLYPIFIYLDRTEYQTGVRELFRRGWQAQVWRRIYLQTAFINLADNAIIWSQKTGVPKFGDTLGHVFGYKTDPFTFAEEDLEAIKILMSNRSAIEKNHHVRQR